MKNQTAKSMSHADPTGLVVGFATTGRASILRRTVALLGEQTRKPDRVIVSAISPDDHAGVSLPGVPLQIITDGRGLTHQRNCVLTNLGSQDIIVFLDDDFIPCPDFLERVWDVFHANRDVVMVTGKVILDGIHGPGLDFDRGLSAVQGAMEPDTRRLEDVYNGYGCNMAIRAAVALKNRVTFDEDLPLYGWLEDVDFSRRLARFGRIVRASDARGVHLGVKSGRTSGYRLGYSQIVNPLYLYRKGTIDGRFGLRLASKNVVANCLKSLFPEPYIDRRGRLMGNMRALLDVMSGTANPKRISDP
jgi:glycosyltransferase involved in cell wall biosynthesis